MRGLFTDGMNSLWHFIFGFFAALFWWIIPLYTVYELLHPYDKNIIIDFSEFIIGYMFGYLTGIPSKTNTAIFAFINSAKK